MVDVTVHVLRQIDVAGSFDLDALRGLAAHALPAGARLGPDEPAAPGVVPARPPVDLHLDDVTVGPFRLQARLRAFDFGVVALRFSLSRSGADGRELVRLGHEVASCTAAFDAEARRLWQEIEPALASSMTAGEPGLAGRLLEDFSVFVLSGPPTDDPADLALVHLLLGEPDSRRLSPQFCRGVLDRAIRYYEDDLVLLAWDAAVIVEPSSSAAGALEIVNVLEMASAQLLEVRYYDAVVRRAMSALAADAARARTTGWLLRSPFASLGRRAAVLALELSEMTDRLEHAFTLVGDSYTVTVYREAAKRFRLVESRQAVGDDIETLASVSETFGSDVHSRRSIVLEILVVLLILIEVLRAW